MRKKTLKGEIRTKDHCLNCGGKFEHMRPKVRRFVKSIVNPVKELEARVSKDARLMCPKCMTEPRKYFLDIYYKERLRIFSDQQGNPLSSYDQAMLLLSNIRHELAQHTFDPTKYLAKDLKNFLFEVRVEAWYQGKLREVEKGNLATSYTNKLKCYKDFYYLPHFKTRDIREIRTYDIYNFYENMPLYNHRDKDKKISLKYIKNILNGLENFFNTMHHLDYIKEMPSFPIITIDRKAPKWVDRKTQLEILNEIPEKHRPIFSFLVFQGVRPGEARAIKVKDVDLGNEAVTITRTFSGGEKKLKDRVKGKVIKPRALNPVLIPLIEKQIKDKHPEAFIFAQENGRHYSETFLRSIWGVVRDSLGLNMNLYQATRHSFASNAVTDKVPLNIIKEVMGHTDIKTTMLYAHADLNSQRIFFKQQTTVIDLKTVRHHYGTKDTETYKK